MPRPLFEREVAGEGRQPAAERVEAEGRDVVVVEVPKWLLIVAEHAPPETLAAVVKSAAERGLLSLDERAAAFFTLIRVLNFVFSLLNISMFAVGIFGLYVK